MQSGGVEYSAALSREIPSGAWLPASPGLHGTSHPGQSRYTAAATLRGCSAPYGCTLRRGAREGLCSQEEWSIRSEVVELSFLPARYPDPARPDPPKWRPG